MNPIDQAREALSKIRDAKLYLLGFASGLGSDKPRVMEKLLIINEATGEVWRAIEALSALNSPTCSADGPVAWARWHPTHGYAALGFHKPSGDLNTGWVDVAFVPLRAQPQPAAVSVAEAPLTVFSDGPWTFEETGQRFTGKDLDEAAFVAYRTAALKESAP